MCGGALLFCIIYWILLVYCLGFDSPSENNISPTPDKESKVLIDNKSISH